MDTLRQDFRYALRRLRRTPGFAAIALVSLALGIGANTAIFTLVNAIILSRPPIEHPEELVDVYRRVPGFSHSTFSYPDYLDLRRSTSGVFSQIAASKLGFAQREVGDGVETIPVELVTGEYFALRGLSPAAGRLISTEDDVTPGGHPVVVLSHAFWLRAFGGNATVLGSELRLNGRPFTVVGVVPASWGGQLRGLSPDAYLPTMMVNLFEPGGLESRGNQSQFLTARMAPGVTLPRVQAALENYATEMRETQPESWTPDAGAFAVPTLDVIMNPMIDRYLLAIAGVLTVVVGLVLLIACANLASFLLAQARDRRREIAIRLALGARRSSLVRQLLAETVLLGLFGGVAGIAISSLLLRVLLGVEIPLPFPITVDVSPDARVLAFTLGVSLFAGVLLGLAPALQSTNPEVSSTIKDENTGGGRPTRFSLRNVLVSGQVAACLVLLVAAGLFLRSLAARQEIDPGFGAAPAALVSFELPVDRYSAEDGRLFFRRALEEIGRMPGIAAVGLTNNMHLNVLNTSWEDVNVDGHTPPDGYQAFQIDTNVSDSGWFEAAGVQLLRGRMFDDRIDVADAPRAVVVNQAFVDRFWPGEDGVGQTIRMGSVEAHIVGVVRTARIRTLGEPPRPFLYRPLSQNYSPYVTLVAGTNGSAERAVPQIFTRLRNLERELVFIETKTMERHLSAMLLPARLGAVVIGTAAALALLLAVIGLYGVVSYTVASRTREVGIRMSLGAGRASVVKLMMSGALRLVALGALIGLIAAAAGGTLLRRLLFGVQPFDPVTFVGVPLLLIVVAAAAAWLPAQRASRVDPISALKVN